jgi:predicted nuclease with TOPRIM domain
LNEPDQGYGNGGKVGGQTENGGIQVIVRALTRYFYIMPCPSSFEERTMVFGLARKSKYVELEKQKDELKAYMNVLTAEMGTLRKEVAQLKMDMTASKIKTRRLQEETNTLRIQRQGLTDSVEIFTKEREIFQKTIQELCQAVRKQKRTR